MKIDEKGGPLAVECIGLARGFRKKAGQSLEELTHILTFLESNWRAWLPRTPLLDGPFTSSTWLAGRA